MTPMTKAVLLVLACAAIGLTACKKGKDTETANDAKPTRPATPSGTMSLHGNYYRTGTFGAFRDCTTGQEWPVANEGEIEALEEAYVAFGAQSGGVVVTIEGGIDYRPRPDGRGKQMMVIVARFVQIGPVDTCRLLNPK